MAEAVTLSEVGKQFRARHSAVPVLHNFHLHVRSGEFLVVLGPSGCGKSTLLRLIAGLEQPSNGSVRLGQEIVRDGDPRCAVMFQEPRLFPWRTVAANVALGARRAVQPRTPDELLRLVGLADVADAFPHQLSGGMAQRAALARALIGQPQVLLLDEPFAALDAFTRMQMQDLLAEACRTVQATVVMVTHDVDEALYLADRIIILGQRPATITSTIDVPFPRPRDRGEAALVALRTQILAHFGLSHAVSSNGADTYTI